MNVLSIFFLLYCNTARVRICIGIHYTCTCTYFDIYFYYKFIHAFLYQIISRELIGGKLGDWRVGEFRDENRKSLEELEQGLKEVTEWR